MMGLLPRHKPVTHLGEDEDLVPSLVQVHQQAIKQGHLPALLYHLLSTGVLYAAVCGRHDQICTTSAKSQLASDADRCDERYWHMQQWQCK